MISSDDGMGLGVMSNREVVVISSLIGRVRCEEREESGGVGRVDER